MRLPSAATFPQTISRRPDCEHAKFGLPPPNGPERMLVLVGLWSIGTMLSGAFGRYLRALCCLTVL
jgi:hypothetical protein